VVVCGVVVCVCVCVKKSNFIVVLVDVFILTSHKRNKNSTHS
jgi:hypothetical protein